MIASGIQPNWRHIFLALVIIAVIWYTFYGSKVNNPTISEKEEIQQVNSQISAISIRLHRYIFSTYTKSFSSIKQPPAVKKLQVEIYYEVWCPDSRRFIIDQALPAWNKLNTIIDIHWKPFGKASVIYEL